MEEERKGGGDPTESQCIPFHPQVYGINLGLEYWEDVYNQRVVKLETKIH